MTAAVADGWVYLEHVETGGTQRVPDDPAVLAAQEARGWRVADGPAGEAPARPVPAAGEGEWVELVHPLTGARHQFPNNPVALAGAGEAGWVAPNKDGSVPKRAAAKAARDAGIDSDDDATEEPAGDADEESDPSQAGDSSATETKE